jgi:hypothetical protein
MESRLRDLLLYGVIAVAILTADALFGIYAPNKEVIYEAFKWSGFAIVTAIVLGEAIHRHRRRWGNRRFWLVLGSFAGLQCALGTAALWRIGNIPALYWAVLLPVNFIALDKCMSAFLDSDQR